MTSFFLKKIKEIFSNKENTLVLIAMIMVAFMRFWKVPELFNFTLGEEIQAHMAWEQVKDFHPI